MEEIAPEKRQRRLGIWQCATSFFAIPSFFIGFYGGYLFGYLWVLANPDGKENNIAPVLLCLAGGAILGLQLFAMCFVAATVLAIKYIRERPRPKGLWRIGFFLYWLNWLAILYLVGYVYVWLTGN